MKGAVRAERLEAPQDFIPEILSRVQKKYVERHYSLHDWTDTTDFLTKLALQMGKLLKGGEPDLNNVAIQVINDFQRVRKFSLSFQINSILIGKITLFYCSSKSKW